MNAVKQGVRSGYSTQADVAKAAAELIEQFGAIEPQAVVFFSSHHHDGAALSRTIRARYPQAQVIGCTTAGEFNQQRYGVGGVSALALGRDNVKRCAAAIARCERGAGEGVSSALGQISAALGVDLRQVDPKRYVGVALLEGLKMREESINEELGNAAPLISFVGGSAGDNVEFKATQVFCNGEACGDGAALLLIEAAAPFVVTKTCSFEPVSGKSWKATKVDEKTRTIFELDGKPVAQVYAGAVDVPPNKLDGNVFRDHPMGLMIDGKPWIRSPQQLMPDGGLRFYCRVSEGMTIHLMRSTDLVRDTAAALADAQKTLGHGPAGMLAFNCILRRLEMDAKNLHAPFLKTFGGMQTAGFHTYGESWLGHINQTFTAIVFS